MTQVNLYNNAYGLDMVGEMLNNLQRRLYTMKDVRLASMRLRGIKFGSHQRQLHYYVEFPVQEHFADHATVQVQLQVPTKHAAISRWPRPAEIDWQNIDCRDWQPQCSAQLQPGQTSTEFMRTWAKDFEDTVSERLQTCQGHPLHPRMRGRGQRLAPATQEVEPPICKPSREGEVCLQSSLAGSAVRMWFKQLRRLQSLNHASKANKQTPSATCYRAELWSAILRAPGFHPSFQAWWKRRESPCDGAPKEFPNVLPGEHEVVYALYQDFLHHFRAFETWHLNQRQASLKMKYEGSLSSIYMDLRDEPKPSIDHIWKDKKIPSACN